MRTNRHLLPAVGAVALLALAGCTGASEPAGTPSETGTATSSEPAATPEESASEPEASEPETEPTEEPAAAGDAACLQGTWIYTAAEAKKSVEAMIAKFPESPLGDVHVEGDAHLRFDGAEMTHWYDPTQVVAIDAEASGMDLTLEVTWTGSTTGQVEVDGNRIRLASLDTDELDMAMRILLNGEELDGLGDLGMADLIGRTGGGLPEGETEFTCSGDSLDVKSADPEHAEFAFTYHFTRE